MKKKKNKQWKRKSGWKNKYRLTRRMKAALGWFSRAALLFGPRGPVFSRGTELKCIMKAVPRLPVVSVHWAKCAKVSNFLFIKTSWPNEHNETGKGKCKTNTACKTCLKSIVLLYCIIILWSSMSLWYLWYIMYRYNVKQVLFALNWRWRYFRKTH